MTNTLPEGQADSAEARSARLLAKLKAAFQEPLTPEELERARQEVELASSLPKQPLPYSLVVTRKK